MNEAVEQALEYCQRLDAYIAFIALSDTNAGGITWPRTEEEAKMYVTSHFPLLVGEE